MKYNINEVIFADYIARKRAIIFACHEIFQYNELNRTKNYYNSNTAIVDGVLVDSKGKFKSFEGCNTKVNIEIIGNIHDNPELLEAK